MLPQVRSPHPATLIAMREGPLDQLSSFPQKTLALRTLQSLPVCVDRVPFFLFSYPMPLPRLLLLGYIGAHPGGFHLLQHRPAVITLVSHDFLDAAQMHLRRLARPYLRLPLDQLGHGRASFRQRLFHRRRIA